MYDKPGMGQTIGHAWVSGRCCCRGRGRNDVMLAYSARDASSGIVAALPLHVIHVACHSKSPKSVNLPIIDKTIVATARDSHSGDQVPVIQQGHVAPDISQCHP